MNMSSYMQGAILQHTLGISAYTPTTTYAALLLACDGETYTEVTGGGYTRISPAWGAASGGSITNSSITQWSVAEENWGSITHIGIFDGSSGGNLLWWDALPEPKSITTNTLFMIGAGEMMASLGSELAINSLILDMVFRNVTLSMPTEVWVGVGEKSGPTLVEPGSAGYVRYQATDINYSESFAPNYATIGDFMLFTADANWGTMDYIGLFDADTAGVLLYLVPMDAVRTIYTGDALMFLSDTIAITIN